VPGVTWLGIFKQANHHPETGQVVGAVIHIAMMTPKRRAQAEKKIAWAESGHMGKPRARRPRPAGKTKVPASHVPVAHHAATGGAVTVVAMASNASMVMTRWPGDAY